MDDDGERQGGRPARLPNRIQVDGSRSYPFTQTLAG